MTKRNGKQTLADRLIAAKHRRDEADANFRALLTEARREGATITALAELLDMPPMTVYRWSGGKRMNPLETIS